MAPPPKKDGTAALARAEAQAAKRAAKLQASRADSTARVQAPWQCCLPPHDELAAPLLLYTSSSAAAHKGDGELLSKRAQQKSAKKNLKEQTKDRSVQQVDRPVRTEKERFCPKCPESLLAPSNGARGDNTGERRALPSVEREHVQKVYDAVAREWHGTRYRTWGGVEDFVKRQGGHSLVADVGCGNGKNMPSVNAAGSLAIGSDFSAGLIGICAERGLEVKVADAINLPYRSNVFDYALNIAVLHHISSEARRIMLIHETMRVVRVGGSALFYAWAHEQNQGVSGHIFEASDVLVPFHKTNGQSSTLTADATTAPAPATHENAMVFQRYCHVYREGELPGLVRGLPWCKVEASYYDCGNWCIEVRKIGDAPNSQLCTDASGGASSSAPAEAGGPGSLARSGDAAPRERALERTPHAAERTPPDAEADDDTDEEMPSLVTATPKAAEAALPANALAPALGPDFDTSDEELTPRHDREDSGELGRCWGGGSLAAALKGMKFDGDAT